MIPKQYESNFRTWQWFGIQEYNPELIGDFTHQLHTKGESPFSGVSWEYRQKEDLYILWRDFIGTTKWWFHLLPERPRTISVDIDGKDVEVPIEYGYGDKRIIETNRSVTVPDDTSDTHRYVYNTHPSEPVSYIKQLTKAVLIDDGVIKKENRRIQSDNSFIQKAKRAALRIINR